MSGKHFDRGSYTLYILLHECSCFIEFIKRVGEKIKCEACQAFYRLFAKSFNEFSNKGARMLDSIYHMTLKLPKFAFFA